MDGGDGRRRMIERARTEGVCGETGAKYQRGELILRLKRGKREMIVSLGSKTAIAWMAERMTDEQPDAEPI